MGTSHISKDSRLEDLPSFHSILPGSKHTLMGLTSDSCSLQTQDASHSLTVLMIEWCFTPLSTVFQLYHGGSSHNSCLSWVSPVLGWGSEVSCSRTFPRKKPRGSVRLEPRTPGLRVKHFTTELRRTPY